MIRDSKVKRGQTLSIDEIKQIPQAIRELEMVVWDNDNGAVLYLFDVGDKTNKIAIKVNYGKGSSNHIVTTEKQETKNISSRIKGKIYEVVQ